MPSATPDAEIPVYRIEHTMPDLRIPAAYRANAAADTADLPIITPGGDRDDPGSGVPRRRQQWGRDRRTRAMEMVPKPVSDRRVAMGRLAIIVTVAAWLGYLVTWFFDDFFAHGHETAVDRAEEILYLLIVSLLTVSALAYLLARLGFFYRTRTHHRSSRAILDQFYDTAAPSLTTIIPSYQEDARVIRQHHAVGRAAGVPGQADRPAHRRPVRAEEPAGPGSARGGPGPAPADPAAAGRARRGRFARALHSFELATESDSPLGVAAMATLAGYYEEAATWLENLAEEPGDRRPHRRFPGQRGASAGWPGRCGPSRKRCSNRPARAWCSSR